MLLEQTAAGSNKTRDLVAEANHRIANSLAAVGALVHQKARSITNGPPLPAGRVVHILAEVSARVDAVGRLHRLLSDTPADAPIDVGAYLQPIAAGLVASLADSRCITLHFACELGCRVTPERALYLGQIVVELVTNSLKYAHPTGIPGQIDILCRQDAGEILIEVADDGIGLPEGFDPARSDSTGLRLVQSLAQQIGGSVTFRSEGLGLCADVRVPSAI